MITPFQWRALILQPAYTLACAGRGEYMVPPYPDGDFAYGWS